MLTEQRRVNYIHPAHRDYHEKDQWCGLCEELRQHDELMKMQREILLEIRQMNIHLKRLVYK